MDTLDRLTNIRTALATVRLTDGETAALRAGIVPPLTPDVKRYLALRGAYSDVLADVA